ncbi:MAG: cobyrinate a,c-diamide synthase, partial [Tannerellaceae bacterium]|nr:cobyrinate a,c-diamide synthase [Tannerellaceae bacterium]
MGSTARFLIGAPASGCGKTTVTLGLLRCLHNRGLQVQPFKCGPDYIDTKFHDLASGAKSYNLDTFLSSDAHVKELMARYGAGKDVCVAEGVMGLFDGYDRMQGSSAGIASLLDLPVVLVVNARSMAHSAAALLYGFKNFCKDIRLAGVIFNFAGSASHYNYLKEACHEVGVEPLGWPPKAPGLEVPSRHLGLSIDREFIFDEFAEKAAPLVEKQIDVDRLLALTAAPRLAGQTAINPPEGHLKIAVARDEAFNFVYHENIHRLERLGKISWFSPLKDRELPDAGFVYLPGGYPELYLPALSGNKSMLQSIR